jgi:zinc transporter ZupT
MADDTGSKTEISAGARVWAGLLPLILLGGLIAAFLRFGAGPIGEPPAPVVGVAFERIEFTPDRITATIRNTGAEAVTITHVRVNEALTDILGGFTFTPQTREEGRFVNRVPRFGRATIEIPYMVEFGQPHQVDVILSDGLKFSHTVDIAAPTPEPNWAYFLAFMLLGAYVGVVPVYIGLLWFPFLRLLGERGVQFLLSLTIGLLVFLGYEATLDAFEIAEKLPSVFQGQGLFLLGLAGSLLTLLALGRRKASNRTEEGERRMLATLISIGIGLHNLGEGLAIGAAYVLGNIALGKLLVIGFAIHNTTEGLAIVAPLARTGVKARDLFLLGAIAGAPTILGTWIGGFTFSGPISVLFLGIGAGAIAQVAYAIWRHIEARTPGASLAWGNVGGFIAGIFVMLATGLFVKGVA